MNKHTKLAIIIAPFLAIGGYILSEYYIEEQASESKVYALQPQGECDVLTKQCVLTSGDFKVSIYDEAGETTVNTTFPLDDATLFLVDEKQSRSYPLMRSKTPYYWTAKTAIRQQQSNQDKPQKLRVILSIKGGKYISEFYSQKRS